MTSGVFAHNKAVFAGGAIYADRASTARLAVEYNHTLAQGLFGACFIMFGNEPIQSTPDQVYTDTMATCSCLAAIYILYYFLT